jgi:cytoskeletal protein RodZ
MAVRKLIPSDGAPKSDDNIVDTPMSTRRLAIGESLRNRRIECGLDLERVAQTLRIRVAVLAAIEEDRFDQLPGPTYAVGFVRAYAAYLGLDAEALVQRFKSETEHAGRKPHLNFPLPVKESHLPTGPILLLCVLLTVLTYGGWYYFYATPRHDVADLVPAVPERLRQLLSSPGGDGAGAAPNASAPATAAAPDNSGSPNSAAPNSASANSLPVGAPIAGPAQAVAAAVPPAPASPQAPVQAQPAPAQHPAPIAAAQPANAPAAMASAATGVGDSNGVPPVENGTAPRTAAAALPPSPDLAQPAEAPDSKSPLPGNYGATDGASRVILRAVADSWVQVRDGHGDLIFTRVLKPGEQYNVPNQAGLSLVVGNAGGLNVVVDGRAAPPLGEPGQVAHNVSLDPTRLLGPVTHAN